MKVNGKEGKLPLRALAARELPRGIARRTKHGFGVPLDLWFSRELKKTLRENLLDRGTPLRQVFKPEVYEPWLKAFTANRPHRQLTRQGLHMRVFMLLAIHTFLTENGL
jgi:asparagine synthase (glutamine-hydrolysing)